MRFVNFFGKSSQLPTLLYTESGQLWPRLSGETEGWGCALPQSRSRIDARRATYKSLCGSSFRLRQSSGFPSIICRMKKHVCREPFRAFENVLIWFDPIKLTHFFCPSFCPFPVIAGMFSGHVSHKNLLASSCFWSSELRSEAAWI